MNVWMECHETRTFSPAAGRYYAGPFLCSLCGPEQAWVHPAIGRRDAGWRPSGPCLDPTVALARAYTQSRAACRIQGPDRTILAGLRRDGSGTIPAGGLALTVVDAFCLSEVQWDQIERRYEEAHEKAMESRGIQADALEYPERLLVALLDRLSDVEKMALALGVMVGRASVEARE